MLDRALSHHPTVTTETNAGDGRYDTATRTATRTATGRHCGFFDKLSSRKNRSEPTAHKTAACETGRAKSPGSARRRWEAPTLGGPSAGASHRKLCRFPQLGASVKDSSVEGERRGGRFVHAAMRLPSSQDSNCRICDTLLTVAGHRRRNVRVPEPPPDSPEFASWLRRTMRREDFEALPEDDLGALRRFGERKRWPAGTILFRQRRVRVPARPRTPAHLPRRRRRRAKQPRPPPPPYSTTRLPRRREGSLPLATLRRTRLLPPTARPPRNSRRARDHQRNHVAVSVVSEFMNEMALRTRVEHRPRRRTL